MRKITEFNELFSHFIFLCWEEQAGKAISTGDIVSSLAGLWKTDSCCERIIMVLPALRRWKALGYPEREGWYFCATFCRLVISFEDGLEKKEAHTVAPACSGRRDDGVILLLWSVIWRVWMHLFTETELELRLLIHPKAILCTEISLYIHTNLFHLFLPAPGHNWGDLYRSFLSLWFVVRCDAHIWLVGQSSHSTLCHLLLILAPCPPFLITLTSLFFFCYAPFSIFLPHFPSFLLWPQLLPKPWIVSPSTYSFLNLLENICSLFITLWHRV